MAGVRQFDEDEVLEAVMQTLWARGYAETTMADLAAAAGVQRGSLYHAYGDKETLLLKALDRYGTHYGAATRKALADPDPRKALEGFFETHLARMAAPSNPAGCLMCQTAMECGGRDPAPAKVVRKQFLRTEAALKDTLDRATAAGLLAEGADTRALARFFLGVSRGMAVMHKAYGDLSAARDAAKTALTVLQSPPAK
ncbi:TetR/AcrR family transcriptional regulator [Pelagibius sp.]|uniref:TetR/AcrR family transcriptional regulator n=1 Tax=Pelagibius sp. TaxID=1931238 RepID=UPI003BB06400